MPVLEGPGDDGRPYDFSRVGGFRMAALTDAQKAQLLHRVADWAKEVLIGGMRESSRDPAWKDGMAPLLESLMKAANQTALYIDNDQLRWDTK